ncbi:MAG: metallophosphoesterase family protein [Acidaminococcaceae bacterium]
MRKLLALALGLQCLFASTAYALKPVAPPSLPAPAPQMLMQVISSDNNTSRTVTWQNTPSSATPYLELRAEQQLLPRLFLPTATALTTPQGLRTIYTVTLTELAAGNNYHYRVGSYPALSAWHDLRTPNSQQLTALIFPDSQSVNYEVWAKTAAQAARANPQTDFFLNLGDLVDNGERSHEWSGWYQGAEPLVTQTPIAPVCGNHETYSDQHTFMEPYLYLAYFPVPANGPVGLERHAYTFVQNNARFFVLNAQVGELAAYHPDLWVRQLAWLKTALAHSTETWKIVLLHRSPLGMTTTKPLNKLGQGLVPLLDQYEVDLLFAGHSHAYGRTAPLVGGQRAAQGTVYFVTGRSGDKVRRKNHARPQEDFFLNPVNEPNYLTLKIQGNTATVQAFHQSGVQFDQVTLTKKLP